MLSDEALHEKLLDGDLAAFDELYARYERPLFGFVRRFLADAPEAEDVLHEIFMALLRESRRGHAARSFKAWVYQVARNLCLNRLRSRKRAAQAMTAVADTPSKAVGGPDQELLHREAVATLRRAVAGLPAPFGELYALRTGGLSYAELAEVFDVPLGTIKSRMHEMVGRLRKEMSA